MNDKSRFPVIAAFYLAMGVVLPILFHAVGLGSMFLPMFLPIAAGGMVLPVSYAAVLGILTPLVSGILTGMPPFFPPVAPLMSVELAILASVSSLLYRKFKLNLLLSLGIAIVAGRVAYVLLLLLIIPLFALPAGLLTTGSVLHGLPGIALLFSIVPFIVKYTEKNFSGYE